MRIRTMFVGLVCLFFALASSACSQYNHTDDFMRSEDNYGTKDAQQTPANRTYSLSLERSLPAVPGPLLVSEQAGYEVAKIDGINAAFVMMADGNAYVAVMANNSATGIFTHGSASRHVDNAGESEGVYDARSGRNYEDPDLLATDTNSYYTTVGRERLSAKALQKIGATVREVHPTVLQVYISSNRDFLNGMTQIMQEYWRGRPIEPYAEPFRDLVRRTFPATDRQDD